MTTQDWFFFFLTFLTGTALGMYIYVAAFKPAYAPEDLSGAEGEASDFSVIGKTYGGMLEADFIRPSFRILGDGSYAFIPGGTGQNALDPVKGNLPSGLIRNLKKAIDDSDLAVLESQATNKNCRYMADSFDYEYRVTLSGEQFSLDTCKTKLSYDDDLAVVLEEIWQFFLGSDGEVSLPSSRGVSGGFKGETFSEKASNWLYQKIRVGE